MITRVEITGFRGIPGTRTFKPEMLTLLTGRNGFGKTTFFDAIDWCLFGPSSRLGGDVTVLQNLYEKHPPNVEVTIEIDRVPTTFRRTLTNVFIDDRVASERDVADMLIVDPDVFPPYLRELGNQVKSVTYLSQDQIRDFVTTSLTSERKALLRGLLGVPNAGVVESSIRRVTDHLASREKDLLATAASLEDEHTESQDAPSFDDSLQTRVAAFLTRVSNRAGRPLTTLGGSREWLEIAVADDERLREAAERALSTLREAAEGVQQAERELTDLQKRRTDIVEQLAQSESELSAAAAALKQTQTHQQAALKARSDLEGRLATVTEYARLQTRAADLEQQLTAAAKERQSAELLANEARAGVDSARTAVEVAERELNDLQTSLVKHEERSRVSRERAEWESRLASVRSKIESAEAAVAAAKTAYDSVTDAASRARAELNDAIAAHSLEEVAAQRSARLAELRSQIKRLLRDEDTICPTCGTQYESHAELLGHIDSMGASAESSLASAGEAMDQRKREDAEVQGKYTNAVAEQERLQRQLEALRAEEADGANRLQALPSFEELDGGPVPEDVARVRGVLMTHNERLSLATTAASQASQTLERATDGQAAIVRELESVRQRVPVVVGVIGESVNGVRAELTKAQEAAQRAEDAVQRRRHDLAALETRSADIKAALAAIDGRLSAEADRRARLLDSIAREAQRLGVAISFSEPRNHSASVAQAEDALRALATRHGEALNTDREELEQAKSLQRRQALNEAASSRHDRLARLAEIENELQSLQSARERFVTIASRIEERSKTEAAKAGGQHLAAIQECIDDLYPHTHLNTVEVDFTEGEMFIRDRWLENGVRPRDYASTGQSNVLALSVFLGLSLRQTFSRIRSVLMDEPVQNLDDLHFLAFLTLIKRVALTRQVIVSTADSNIGQIFTRQLSAWSDQGRGWCEYEWTGFEPQTGPVIRRHSGRRRAVA